MQRRETSRSNVVVTSYCRPVVEGDIHSLGALLVRHMPSDQVPNLSGITAGFWWASLVNRLRSFGLAVTVDLNGAPLGAVLAEADPDDSTKLLHVVSFCEIDDPSTLQELLQYARDAAADIGRTLVRKKTRVVVDYQPV